MSKIYNLIVMKLAKIILSVLTMCFGEGIFRKKTD